MKPARNYRPPLKTQLRLRRGLFWSMRDRLPNWNTVLAVAILVAAYPTVAYVDALGDRKAAQAEAAKLKLQASYHTQCMTDRYATGKTPTYNPPRKQDANKAQ